MNWPRCWVVGLSSSIDWGARCVGGDVSDSLRSLGAASRAVSAASKVVVGLSDGRWFEIETAFAADRIEKSGKVARVWWTVVDGCCCADAGRRKGGRRWWGADGCVIVGPAVVRCFGGECVGCPPKAQGRSGRAEQIQLQEVPGYLRHEPVEVQAQKFPTSQGRPWVEGGVRVGRGGRGLAGHSRAGGQENRGYRGGAKRKESSNAWPLVAVMERLVSRSFWLQHEHIRRRCLV